MLQVDGGPADCFRTFPVPKAANAVGVERHSTAGTLVLAVDFGPRAFIWM